MSFRFKQFFVEDSRCAMKVGTDGVLLGAWCPLAGNLQPQVCILDIGTGCGLIALMLAQRTHAQIDAIDIDPEAVEQAKENFESSPWSEHLHAYHARLQEWQFAHDPLPASSQPFYHLIVSNPPYFQNSLKNPDSGRQTARHTDTLSYNELLLHSTRLLGPQGHLALILPAESENEVCLLAEQYSLCLSRVTRVYSKSTKPARRVLLFFSKSPLPEHGAPLITPPLVLEDEKGGRSEQYAELTKDFYL